MKKYIKIIITIISISLLMTACVGAKENSNSSDVFENYREMTTQNNETVYIESGVIDNDNAQFIYNGQPIEFDYKYNTNVDCEMGLQIFINGIQQEFVVKGEEYDLYKINCNADEDMIFHVSLNPNNGVKGETSNLIFANIYYPEILTIGSSDNNTFGNYQKISQPLPWGIKMNADAPLNEYTYSQNYSEHKLTSSELSKYKRQENGLTINTLDEYMSFDSEKDTWSISLDDESYITFNLYGNFPGRYRISLYADFKRIQIDGCDYLDIDVENNTEYTFTVATDSFKNYTNFYAVAIALDNTQGLLKSHSFYIFP